jgi:hypothetical protein
MARMYSIREKPIIITTMVPLNEGRISGRVRMIKGVTSLPADISSPSNRRCMMEVGIGLRFQRMR